MKLDNPVSYDDRVTRVAASLIPNDHRNTISQQVNYLSFAFVSPLRSSDYHRWNHPIAQRSVSPESSTLHC